MSRRRRPGEAIADLIDYLRAHGGESHGYVYTGYRVGPNNSAAFGCRIIDRARAKGLVAKVPCSHRDLPGFERTPPSTYDVILTVGDE